ncbi:hypothetical protein DFJ75_4350 [Williamsia muralis]|uniref:Uncharacterized protein n=1 Tax=Williamsia marianensis TaxID=85044 RepID=A0A495KB20_WILMA|nr:hypothetical protein [Williamsia muralis]RKR97472.1 hypothetical protein DFJ75_4350 [Williamsia muralis]
MTEVGQSGVGVVTEDDPTPFVRTVARSIRSALGRGESPSQDGSGGERVVVISAKDTRQSATCFLADDRIEIIHGASPEAQASVVVDVYDLAVDAEASSGDENLIKTIATLTNPSTTVDWKSAASDFWSRTCGASGMPSELIIECARTHDRVVLGSGLPTYRIVAEQTVLSRLCTGTVGLLEALGAGEVAIQGTLPQLSVMTGAFNKMRFDV